MTLIGGIAGIAVGAVLTILGAEFMAGIPGMELMAGIGAGLFVIGIIALIAGIFTLRRRSWRFALAGAILALFPIIPLGVLAIIFVSMGKREFA